MKHLEDEYRKRRNVLTMNKDATITWILGSEETILMVWDSLRLWNGSSATGSPDTFERHQQTSSEPALQLEMCVCVCYDFGDCRPGQRCIFSFSFFSVRSLCSVRIAVPRPVCLLFTWSLSKKQNNRAVQRKSKRPFIFCFFSFFFHFPPLLQAILLGALSLYRSRASSANFYSERRWSSRFFAACR